MANQPVTYATGLPHEITPLIAGAEALAHIYNSSIMSFVNDANILKGKYHGKMPLYDVSQKLKRSNQSGRSFDYRQMGRLTAIDWVDGVLPNAGLPTIVSKSFEITKWKEVPYSVQDKARSHDNMNLTNSANIRTMMANALQEEIEQSVLANFANTAGMIYTAGTGVSGDKFTWAKLKTLMAAAEKNNLTQMGKTPILVCPPEWMLDLTDSLDESQISGEMIAKAYIKNGQYDPTVSSRLLGCEIVTTNNLITSGAGTYGALIFNPQAVCIGFEVLPTFTASKREEIHTEDFRLFSSWGTQFYDNRYIIGLNYDSTTALTGVLN
jgi:hypothetical protein